MKICFTKHSIERYEERFGKQELHIIEDRFKKSRFERKNNDGSWDRVWGNIVFTGLSSGNDITILTIKIKNPNK